MNLTSDASGLCSGISDGETGGGGRWNDSQKIAASANETNYLELWAAFMGLRAYYLENSNIHVSLISIDNTTAIAYINQMGGMTSHKCNELA